MANSNQTLRTLLSGLSAAVAVLAVNAASGQTDSLHSIGAVSVVYANYRSAATHGTVDSAALGRRFEPSALPILTEQTPGLFIVGRGVMGYGASTGAAGGMTIRGIGGQPTAGVLVTVDGMPQYMGLMGHPLADSYLAGNVESVEVVRGAASAMYGSGAMGGVINIRTRGLREEGARTTARLMYGSHGTASATASTALRRGGFTSSVSLNHNRSDGHRPDMGFGETGGSARFGYDLSRRWALDGGVDITAGRSSNPGTVSDPILDNDADITRGTAFVRARNRSNKTRGSVDVYHNFGRHDINDGYRPAQAENPPLQWFHSRDAMSGVSARQSVSLFRWRSVVEGAIEARSFGGRSYNNIGTVRSGERDVSEWEAAAWFDYSWTPGTWINLDATIRADRNSKAGTEWIPQLGVVLNPAGDWVKPTWLVKASAAKGFRNPTIRELYMFAPSNPDLKAERLMNYDLSVEYAPRRLPLRASLTLFLIDGGNMIQTVVNDGKPLWVNSGRVRNHGVEFDAAWQATKRLSVAANYTWLGMRYKTTGAPEHKLYLSVSYSRPKWGAETGAQRVGSLYTQVTPELRTQSYVAWNLRAWWNAGSSVRLFARAENLLDARYEMMAGYPMPGITAFGGVDFNF